MQRRAVKKYFFENLDTLACILGIIFGILITSLYLISKTIHLLMLGLALTFASLVYLALKNRQNVPNASTHKSTKILYEIIFFLLFSTSLMVLFTNENRPFSYFILIALCSGFLALSILHINTQFEIIFQILKIFMISFNLKYSLFISFAGTGVDYWIHLKMNSILVQEGFIDVLLDKEKFFPLMHIQTAVHQIITSTPIKEATNFAIILPLIISSICVFLVARKIFDEKIGLLAMLIMNITDYHTYWGSAPQTTTFGICIFFIIIFVIFQMALSNQNWKIWTLILIIFFLSLILTHAVSSFILLITIMGLFVGSFAYKKFYDNYAAVFPPIPLLFLYGIMLLEQWSIAVYNEISGKSFFYVIVSTLDYYIIEHAVFLNRPESIAEYITTLPPFIERAANTVGLSLLMFLAAIGCLFWLSKSYRNRFTFSMLTCTILLLFITFGFPLFGIRNIIPSRWFAFMYFFLSIMAACAVLFVLTKIPKPRWRMIILAITIIGLTFFMSTSTISNLDHPLWLKNSTISTSYTVQELKGAETLTRYSNSVFSDSRYGGSVMEIYYESTTYSLFNEDPLERKGEIYVWRKYMMDRPIRVFVNVKGYYDSVECSVVLGEDYLKKLAMVQKVYSDGDISGYFIQNDK